MNLEKLSLEDLGSVKSESSDFELPETSKKDKKSKKEKLSYWSKVFNKSKIEKKPERVAVIFLRDNGIADPMMIDVKNGFFQIAGRTYHQRRDCNYSLGKERIPLAVIREKDLIPIGRREWDDKKIEEKVAEFQDHTLKAIRHAELVRMGEKESGSISTKQIILWGLIIVIGGAILMSYL